MVFDEIIVKGGVVADAHLQDVELEFGESGVVGFLADTFADIRFVLSVNLMNSVSIISRVLNVDR